MKKTDLKAVEKARGVLEEMYAELDAIRSTVEDAFNSKGEKWQESEAGQKVQTQVDAIQCAVDNLETAKDSLQDLLDAEND